MWTALPASARAYHLVLVLAATTSVIASLTAWSTSPVPTHQHAHALQLLLTTALMVACAGSTWYGDVLANRAAPQDVFIMLAPAFHLAALLLLPLPAALAVVATTVMTLQLRRRPALFKQVFNTSVYVLSIAVAAAAFRVAARGSHEMTHLVLSAGLAAAVFAFFDVGAFLLHMWLAFHVEPRKSGFLAINEKLSHLSYGILIATLWVISPALVVLLVPLGITLQRSVAFRPVERASVTNPKTGLYNDRAFQSLAKRELLRAVRTNEPVALLMLDLDHLRDINNTHGHLMGDKAIWQIAEVLRATLRDIDIAARFGGEEFAVLLPATSLPEAAAVAERIREQYAGTVLTAGPRRVRVSVSVGVAPADAGQALDDVVRAADKALYEAKHAGRNTVRVSPPHPGEDVVVAAVTDPPRPPGEDPGLPWNQAP